MSEKTATPTGRQMGTFRGDARHYSLSEPLDGAKHVIVSAVDVPHSGPETYIFPSDEGGEVVDWGELRGSYRGGFSHEEALAGAGYVIAE